jgi:hypothetical protein
MGIIKKPSKVNKEADKAAEDFINGAPDGAAPRLVRKGKKVQITIALPETLLERVETLAEKLGQTRAGIINLAIVQMLDDGIRFDSARLRQED